MSQALLFSHSAMSGSLQSHGLQPARLLCPWDFPGKNIGVGLPFPPPGDHPDLGIKPVSPALVGKSFTLNHQGSPPVIPMLLVVIVMLVPGFNLLAYWLILECSHLHCY